MGYIGHDVWGAATAADVDQIDERRIPYTAVFNGRGTAPAAANSTAPYPLSFSRVFFGENPLPRVSLQNRLDSVCDTFGRDCLSISSAVKNRRVPM